MGKFTKKPKTFNGPKSKKLIRKEKRQEKKQRKNEYYVNRTKVGKFVLNQNNKPTKTANIDKELSSEKNPPKKQTNNKKSIVKNKEGNQNENTTKKVQFKQVDAFTEEVLRDKRNQKKLQNEMKKHRKIQLAEANREEDKVIKRLEKDLKLNKRKTKSIPKSFEADGLDYLLEMCDPEKMKNVVSSEQQFTEGNEDFEEDFALISGKTNKKINKNNKSDSEPEDEDEIDDPFFKSTKTNSKKKRTQGDESDSELPKTKNKKIKFDEEILNFNSDDINSDIEDDDSNDFDNESNDFDNESNNNDEIEDENSDDSDENMGTDFSDNNSDENDLSDKNENDSGNKKNSSVTNSDSDSVSDKSNDETWEDIYGRKRTKDGEILPLKQEKYVPPALRNQMDSKRSEKLLRLKKQCKGLLNRLAESNMHSISSQIEELYMSNSRNDMNETLTNIIFESLISAVHTPERLLLEHVMLITILHANVGTEVGANFLLNVIKKFVELLKSNYEVENKQLDNTVHIIAQLYNFKVFHAQLLYQIIEKLTSKFEEKHVECILLVLKNVGFSLRKDDPIALKQIILDLQKRASTVNNDNARVKFMLDILLAIKNNNVTKIPNYDTTYSEHLKKLMRGFIRKGNYVTQLNISLEDLLKADERGKWWVVGSAWTGMDEKKNNLEENNKMIPTYSKKLLELAKKQRMNTDTRRNIFCIIMTAEDYLDAFEKLLHLGLKNQQEREIIHVILHCSLQEKKFNRYYAILAQKFCDYDRRFQMTVRCSIWDKLKALTDCSGSQLSNMAKLLAHLFLQQSLPISTLKVIEFGELDKITLRFMRQVLLSILLHDDQESCLQVFSRVASTPKLKMFRDSLRLFIHHFLLKNLKEGMIEEEQRELLTNRAQMVEKTLISSEYKTHLM